MTKTYFINLISKRTRYALDHYSTATARITKKEFLRDGLTELRLIEQIASDSDLSSKDMDIVYKVIKSDMETLRSLRSAI